ncbi:hypothetical protein D3C71_2068320 [compost metagenome]
MNLLTGASRVCKRIYDIANGCRDASGIVLHDAHSARMLLSSMTFFQRRMSSMRKRWSSLGVRAGGITR